MMWFIQKLLLEKYCKAEPISISTDTIPGKKIKVIGMVEDNDGKPVAAHWFIYIIPIPVAGLLPMPHMFYNTKETSGMQDYSVDDERLVGTIRESSIRNDFMISKPEKAESPFVQRFSYSITLQKQ